MRVAIITGAAGGIGAATVRKLLGQGWMVVAVDQDAMPDEISPTPDRVLPIVTDLRADGAADKIAETTVARFGRIDLLVNNAGIAGALPVGETGDDNLARIMEINFTVPFRLSRAALKHMLRGASIVHVASVLCLRATPSTSAYTASKAALAGLTRQMAVDYGPRGIRCNAVAPGLVETGLTAARLRNDAGYRRIWADGTPWPRLGRPEDVAAAIGFLASSEAEFINGHTLVVDGGWSAGPPGG